ncbi:hypothetical protein A9P82_10135 [Arachidicoccus ginsenosidimutans]|nr:hypothetical protein A9P82_10135 [Arachidicoccus sp. BS20]
MKLLRDYGEKYNIPDRLFTELPDDKAKEILKAILQGSDENATIDNHTRHVSWVRLAAAAVFVLAFISGFYYLSSRKVNPDAEKTVSNVRPKTKIQPGHQGLVLTLNDGKKIILDTVKDGIVATQNHVKIIKKNGIISYVGAGMQTAYNTASTDKGRRYRVLLPDGTQVWLDAASSIRYPLAFNEKQRVVNITGQAYFEVAKNPEQPFIVKINDGATQVEVLGTHFNINAYPDEDQITTTLLEGKVKISNQSGSKLLQPGQQAQLVNKGQIKIVENVNLNEVTAWKDNQFYFVSTDIKTIMRQASRWYDADVEYRANINDRFNAEIPASINISDFLKTLELTGKVKFTIENKKIIVTQ